VQGHEWQHTARTRERHTHIRNFVSSSWVEREAGDIGGRSSPHFWRRQVLAQF
jgi:hypothetical protein